MKGKILVLLAGLLLTASIALAATPAAPVMSMTVKTTKVGEGFGEVNDSRQVVIDGNNVYVGYNRAAWNLEPCIARSTDGGLSWTLPAVMSTTGSDVRIAKAKDPLNSAKNIIVAAWSDVDGLKYSYLTDRTTTTGWSTPVVVSTDTIDSQTLKIGASPNGAVHLFYSGSGATYYASAANAEAAFTTPVTLPWTQDWDNYGIAFDSANNIYVAETNYSSGTTELYFHKKAAASSTWSSIKVVANTATAHIGDNVSIAVYDANTIYIAYKLYVDTDANPSNHMWVASTSNGGSSWTKKIVTPNATVYGTYPSITVNSSKVISVVGHYVDWGVAGRVSINKSSDNGATWSANVTVPGNAYQGSTLDASGKVAVVSSLYYNTASELDPKFFSGTVQTWDQPAPIYFTREK